jgi:hypothetical protein
MQEDTNSHSHTHNEKNCTSHDHNHQENCKSHSGDACGFALSQLPDVLLETQFLETVLLDMNSGDNEKIQKAHIHMETFYQRQDSVQLLLQVIVIAKTHSKYLFL